MTSSQMITRTKKITRTMVAFLPPLPLPNLWEDQELVLATLFADFYKSHRIAAERIHFTIRIVSSFRSLMMKSCSKRSFKLTLF